MSIFCNYFLVLNLLIVFNIAVSVNPLSEASNDFGINVLNKIAANKGNNIISPLSLSSALGMVHLGAKGETNNELREVLGYINHNIADSDAHKEFKILFEQILAANNKSQYHLNVANRVMAQNKFAILNEYRNFLQTNYNASIQEVDFTNKDQKATDIVNKWVSEKTNNKITSLLDKPLDPLTKLVILNAVYFKGNWLKKFNPQLTKEETFFNNGDKQSKVPMMFKVNTKFNYTRSKQLDSDILELPYTGGDISMYVVLPRELNGLQKLSSVLTEQNFKSAIASFRLITANLYLPKFKIQQSYTLSGQLKSLGLKYIFTDNADFSGINGQKNLKVSNVFHKVFIEVNEEGSEAAAATAVIVESKMAIMPQEFKVDHPFIFVIRDNRNNQNLFFGQINQLIK